MTSLHGARIAYLCLQATTPGQASYAHVHEIIKGLRRRGAVVELFEPSYAGTKAPSALERIAEFARVQRRVLSELDRFDVLYVRGHPLAWPAATAARRRAIPVVHESNGMVDDLFFAWPATRAIAPVVRWAAKSQLQGADAVIAGSQGLSDWIARFSGARATVIPNGVDVEIFSPDVTTDRPLPVRFAAFVGSLAPWQGLSTSLAALADPAWPSGVDLVIAGDGVERDTVLEAAARTERIHYLGTIPYTEVAGVLSKSMCSLVNKEQPAFERAGISPLKLYESMACAVPVIATSRMPGLTEVVEEQRSGLIVPQRDPTALARAVSWLDGNREEARAMGERGRAYAIDECTWDARAGSTAQVLCGVLGSDTD